MLIYMYIVDLILVLHPNTLQILSKIPPKMYYFGPPERIFKVWELCILYAFNPAEFLSIIYKGKMGRRSEIRGLVPRQSKISYIQFPCVLLYLYG